VFSATGLTRVESRRGVLVTTQSGTRKSILRRSRCVAGRVARRTRWARLPKYIHVFMSLSILDIDESGPTYRKNDGSIDSLRLFSLSGLERSNGGALCAWRPRSGRSASRNSRTVGRSSRDRIGVVVEYNRPPDIARGVDCPGDWSGTHRIGSADERHRRHRHVR